MNGKIAKKETQRQETSRQVTSCAFIFLINKHFCILATSH